MTRLDVNLTGRVVAQHTILDTAVKIIEQRSEVTVAGTARSKKAYAINVVPKVTRNLIVGILK